MESERTEKSLSLGGVGGYSLNKCPGCESGRGSDLQKILRSEGGWGKGIGIHYNSTRWGKGWSTARKKKNTVFKATGGSSRQRKHRKGKKIQKKK